MKKANQDLGSKKQPVKLHWRTKNLVGRIYGRLTVVEWKGIFNKNSIWICQCLCGKQCEVYGCHLKTGATSSCGCFASEVISKKSRTHGMSGKNGHPLYRIWKAMIQRCYNKNVPEFRNYGGRGISVCERWRHSFPNFLQDMGDKPSKNHSIDRIDNESGYFPENCKWSTRLEQANNKRNNILHSYKGQSKTLTQWSRHLGIDVEILVKEMKSCSCIEDFILKTKSMSFSMTHPAMIGPQ
jgi:hypothetical protein